MQKNVVGNQEPRQVTTWLPINIIQELEDRWLMINERGGYGSIHIELSKSEICEIDASVKAKAGHQF